MCIIFLINLIGSYLYASNTIDSLLETVREDNIEKIYELTGNHFVVINKDENLSIYDYLKLGEDSSVFSLPSGTLKNLSYDVKKTSLKFPYILFEINMLYANPKTVIATGVESQKLLDNFEEKYLEQVNNESTESDWIYRDVDNVVLIDENNYSGNDIVEIKEDCLIGYNIFTHHFENVDAFYIINKGFVLKNELISQETVKIQEINKIYFDAGD